MLPTPWPPGKHHLWIKMTMRKKSVIRGPQGPNHWFSTWLWLSQGLSECNNLSLVPRVQNSFPPSTHNMWITFHGKQENTWMWDQRLRCFTWEATLIWLWLFITLGKTWVSFMKWQARPKVRFNHPSQYSAVLVQQVNWVGLEKGWWFGVNQLFQPKQLKILVI